MNRFLLLLVLAVLSLPVSAVAQRPGSQSPNGNRNRLTVRPKYDPRFSIEPLVQRLNGRSGDVLAFSFQATSKARSTRVQILPVALRQEVSGRIGFDEQADTADMIQITSPTEMLLAEDDDQTISGVIQLPSVDVASNYMFGILVRDIGLGNDNADAPQTGAGVQVKFVTQYLVRIEIDVSNARTENARQLVLSDTMVESVDGRPRLRTRLTNPTGTTFILGATSKIYSRDTTERLRPFGLTLPSRQSGQGDERYEIMILPESAVDLVEFLPSAVSSGRYKVDLDLKKGSSTVKHEVTDLVIDADLFPAQAVMIAELDNRISASPAQIELSQIRGGSRRMSLNIRNPTDRAAEITLGVLPGPPSAQDVAEGSPPGAYDADSKTLIIQPTKMTLSPGRSRKVSITLRSASASTPVQLATLDFQARLDGEAETIHQYLPVAILRDSKGEQVADLENLRFLPSNPTDRFVADVINRGSKHIPLVARLRITGQSGTQQEIQAGFSRWLMPGETGTVEFPIRNSLTPDTYELNCELQVAGEIKSIVQIVEIGTANDQSAGRESNRR